MTQEEKAQAYDEALNKAKIEINTKGIGETVNLCYQLFPQLAKSDDEESEDERIRKWLYDLVDEGAYLCERPFATESILAYLEKQKESLHIPETCKETANSFTDGIIEVRSFQRGMEEGRKLEKQKEQNDEDGFLEDELSAFLQNYDKEYDDDAAVSDVARHFYEIGKKQKEQKPHTDEEKEYIRTIKSIISDFIRDKKPENLAYYQRIYDWLDGRHVPFSCGHENGKPADPVFSKQEYESFPIISTDTTSAKPAGATINSEPIPTENHSVDIPLAEWSKEDEEIYTFVCNFFETCWWSKTWDISREQVLQMLKSLPEKFVLQPKQELDVEDKLMIKCCLEAINVYKHKAKRGKFLPARFNIGGYLASPEKVESWLKFLPERINLQPKQEWSEEDEHRRDGIIQWLREYQEKFNPKYDSLSIESIESLIDWLKSLRPSWKPSEEQMAMLLAVINEPNNAGAESCHLALKSLHEHLKKLM